MLLYRLADGHEDDALLFQLLLESRLHGDRVHDGIHRHTAQCETFLQRDSQFVECLHQLRVDVVHGLHLALLLCHRVGIVRDSLIVYLRKGDMRP